MFRRLILVIPFTVPPLFSQGLNPPKLRLPDDIRPLECRIQLRITPGVDRFSGVAEIDVDVKRATPAIWLHAKELQFTDARVGDGPVKVETTDTDFVAISPAQPLVPGRTRIRVAYNGTVSRNLTDGLFQQKEGDDWYVFSKFEPITARRAFPCFDEPSFKIPWQVTFADDGAKGYYRFTYERKWFERMLDKARDSLGLREKVTLIYDVRALMDAGRIDAALGMSLALRFNDSPQVQIVTATQGLVAGMSRFIPDQMRANWARFVRAWLGERARQMGWQPRPGESEDQREIRLAVVPFVAIDGGDPELGAEALKLARAWLKDRKAIDPDTVVVVVAAARHGDRAFFDDLLAGLKTAKDLQDRAVIIMALGSFRDPEIERDALGLIFKEGVDHRELSSLLFLPWQDTRPIVWAFVQENFDRLSALMPGARGIPFGATLPGVTGGFCDESRLLEVERFFEPMIVKMSGGERNLTKALENIRLCIAGREALGQSMITFLSKY